MISRSFSPHALTALTQAVTQLAISEGSHVSRLSEAVRYLVSIRPADLDAQLWSELVRARGNISRGGSTGQLRWAAAALIRIPVRYSSYGPLS